MRTADAIVFVVEATVGATTADEAAARLLQRSGKPVFLAANKVDNERGEADAAELWSLGLGEPYPISGTRSSTRCPRCPRWHWAGEVHVELRWWASRMWARARY